MANCLDTKHRTTRFFQWSDKNGVGLLLNNSRVSQGVTTNNSYTVYLNLLQELGNYLKEIRQERIFMPMTDRNKGSSSRIALLSFKNVQI